MQQLRQQQQHQQLHEQRSVESPARRVSAELDAPPPLDEFDASASSVPAGSSPAPHYSSAALAPVSPRQHEWNSSTMMPAALQQHPPQSHTQQHSSQLPQLFSPTLGGYGSSHLGLPLPEGRFSLSDSSFPYHSGAEDLNGHPMLHMPLATSSSDVMGQALRSPAPDHEP